MSAAASGPTKNSKKGSLVEDRRRLVEHALQVFRQQGGRMQLPIGMTAAEPWLLDALDVPALLGALTSAASGGGTNQPPLDLLALCQRGTTRTATLDSSSRAGSSRRTSDATAAAAAEFAAPQLQLPALETGLTEEELKDLAYLVFACNCPHEVDLLDSVRSNLGIDEARAAEAQRLLALVNSAMGEQAGPLSMSNAWTASLELPVCMLGVLLPRDFSRFRSFVMWRDTLSHVLLATLTQGVKGGWSCQEQQQQHVRGQQLQLQSKGSGGGTAQQLMARLKAALRRLDVRDADDFDEQEYRAASAAVRQQAQDITQCTTAGWAFSWALRVRLYEVLLWALFDCLDESEYVAHKDGYLHVLESRLRPLLCIPPPMHTAILAWVHFRQYVITQAPPLLSETRGLLYKLASIAADAAAVAAVAAPAAAGGSSGAAPLQQYSQQDAAFASNVGQAVVDWIVERLSDFHSRLEALGGPAAVSGLVDLLSFASTCRGASEEEVGRLLLEAVSLSVGAELHRRLDAAAAAAVRGSDSGDGSDQQALRCIEVCKVAKELVAAEATWTRGFDSQLPEAFPVALSVLQEAAGAVLLPWLSTQPVLEEEVCEALRCALDLEPRLMGPIRAASAAAGGCRYACTTRLFASARPWNMPAQLQPLLSAWLDKQMCGFSVWVDRQLQQEDWRPLGHEQPHSASARELRRIAMESMDALFGLGLPLPPASVRQYLQGIAGMMIRYLDAILSMLGSEAVMIPPTPHLTRYKREVAVAQEEAESALPGMPTQQPPATAANRRGVCFADSVRRVEEEPCAARVSGLTTPVLVVMMASLAYLADTLQLLSQGVKQMRQQEQQQEASSYNSSSAVTAPPAPNPFLVDDGDAADSLLGSTVGSAANAGGGYQNRNSSSAGGAASSSPAWAGGWSQQRSGGSFGGRDEQQFGSLHETGQKLRGGLAAVGRWLAVRVVWWEQRAGWCELLYRHRVTSCRIDWLLDALAATLQDNISLLPQQPQQQQDMYEAVALELLRQAARALERVLLDGGPCRWFIAADADHLREDVEELRKLFFQAKVPMQDIRTCLLGLEGVLRLMGQQTGPLIDAHRAARRAALLAGPAAPATPPSGAAAAAAAAPSFSKAANPFAPATQQAGAGGSGSSANSRAAATAHAVSSGGGSSGSSSSMAAQALGPLAAAKLASRSGLSSGSPTAAAAEYRGSSGGASAAYAGPSQPHHSRQPTGGSTGSSALDEAASASSYYGTGSSSSAAGQWGQLGTRAAGGPAGGPVASAGVAGAGGAGLLGGVPGSTRRTAMDVAAAGGAVESQEPILLRVLCHRADHAASKYLKEHLKIGKARDETIKETLGRLARLNRI